MVSKKSGSKKSTSRKKSAVKRMKSKVKVSTKRKAYRIARVSIGAALEKAGQELRGRNERDNKY